MRILLSYASEFDKGEGHSYSRVLRQLGHEIVDINTSSSSFGAGVKVMKSGYPADVTAEELLEEHGKADLYLYIEPLGLIPRGLENVDVPTACIISDVHRNLEARLRMAKLFDHVFLYQRNYVRQFTDHDSAAVHWLPYACDTELFRDLKLARELDVAFVGQLFERNSERRRIVSKLSQMYRMNEQRYYLQNEIPGVYSKTKIVINLPVADDLNFRFFEAMSCGALLITKRCNNGQEILFKEGVHYVAFDNESELMDKVDYYLKNESDRTKIALAGNKEIMSKNTLKHRLKTLIGMVENGPKLSGPIRKMDDNEVLKAYADIYERDGRIEALLRMAADHRLKSFLRFRLLLASFKSYVRRVLLGW